jgi:hypothetical protein
VRRFVRDVLGGWGRSDEEWLCLQVVSELAANAVIHARTPYEVSVVEQRTTLRVGIRDHSPRRVQPRRYGDDATTGRGLWMVAQLSHRWGEEIHQGGKTVWAELDSSAAQASLDADEVALIRAFSDDDAEHAMPSPTSGPPRRVGQTREEAFG